MREDIICLKCGYETPAVEVGVEVKSQGQHWYFETQEEVDDFLKSCIDAHECIEDEVIE